ncbi:MAG: NAD-dependent deacylase [bacterium]
MIINNIVKKRIKNFKKVTVLTGAGVSAESGVPTFRGEHGLWKKYRAEELANFDAFMNNPQLVWEWYNYRKKLILEVEPNPGHYALVEIEKIVPEFTLITQNVDDLHRKAGSKSILELHGNIMRSKCLDCGKITNSLTIVKEGELPRCICGGLLRPDVVWFGEMLPQNVLSKSFRVSEGSELFFSIGTSAVVQPAASLPLIAKRKGSFVVEINTEPTLISDAVDIFIQGKSGEILPELVDQLWQDI